MHSDDVYDLIEAADKCRKEIVLCLLGKPGIGKTEAVERFAKDHNRNVVHIITSQILPSEVSGMTMPNQETKSMDVFDHYRLSHMKDGDILFFDELLKGQQQVLNACLTLIQERRLMSGTKLPDILIIAAANELSTPVQLPLEIRQRFMFVEVEWDKDSWIDYMKGLGFDREHERLKQLALKIQTSLNNSNASAWNVLTPRTATKLCLWMRDADDKEVVHRFIGNQFDADIATSIRDIACGSAVGLPSQQIAEKVIDIIKPIYIDPHYNDPEDQLSVVMQTAKSVVDGNINDAKDLFNMLKKLPEWEEIKKELANTTIKNDIEF